MKKLLILAVLGAFSLFFQPAYAGHDFMDEMRKFLALTKKESCSNGKTVIEHRLGEIQGVKISLVLVILEPDADSRKSQFYSEKNKDFYSLIFYKMSDVQNETQASYLMKKIQSGNLEELTASQWLQEMNAAESNAAKSIMQQPGSDCVTTYKAPNNKIIK